MPSSSVDPRGDLLVFCWVFYFSMILTEPGLCQILGRQPLFSRSIFQEISPRCWIDAAPCRLPAGRARRPPSYDAGTASIHTCRPCGFPNRDTASSIWRNSRDIVSVSEARLRRMGVKIASALIELSFPARSPWRIRVGGTLA